MKRDGVEKPHRVRANNHRKIDKTKTADISSYPCSDMIFDSYFANEERIKLQNTVIINKHKPFDDSTLSKLKNLRKVR